MRAPIALAVFALSCAPAFAVERDFNDVVRAISDEFRTTPVHIPLFGLVNAVAFVARPAGASHIDLAVFKHLKLDMSRRDPFEVIQKAVGRSWSRFVQVRSHRRGQDETVMVYMRTEGRQCRLLVATLERDQATVVQLRVNPEGLQRWISYPRESAHSNNGRGGSGDQ